MILSKENLGKIKAQEELIIPDVSLLSLPERVLQFGTGVLLRGLPDYFIDKANRQNIFNGRVVVVKSTSSGGTDAFETQNGLFTLCVRGIENNNTIDKTIINSSISRVLSAREEWNKILECASNEDMQLIISNTTEVGIALVDDDINSNPPVSFPGKLLAFLLARYKAFNGSNESGMVIVPTELIVDNATKLKAIVIELAKRNSLDEAFIDWIGSANDFCNSLVDRIVPGKLPQAEQKITAEKLGYTDELIIISEAYRLWAIETTSERSKKILSFAKVDTGVIIADNIDVYRELKLRLLNGTHSFTCGLAFLSGFRTVKDAMNNATFFSFETDLMMEAIAPSIVYDRLSLLDAKDFAKKVLDRFRNPYIEHQWISITMQYSSKMKMRNVPIILKNYEHNGFVSDALAFGFAGYILFMKSEMNEQKEFVGTLNDKEYKINDDHAALLHSIWKNNNEVKNVVQQILSNQILWGTDLSVLNGFAEKVAQYINSFLEKGVLESLQLLQSNKISA
ncbi:MAG: tagaturonate reductase [Bacteroidota bacterium]|nr:tagaturonate reductase [Bacteroidota bacterium]